MVTLLPAGSLPRPVRGTLVLYLVFRCRKSGGRALKLPQAPAVQRAILKGAPPCFQSPFRAAKSICENALRGPSRCAN